TGGAGNDIFQFLTTDAIDRIMDFAAGDKIDLSGIDADVILDGDQGFAFIGGEDFGGVAGQLRYEGGFVQGDTNGDGLADFSINIANYFALQGTDFVL
ncbi:MAG TPA: RTX toxin, partial [Sphingomicrobium sp.]